MKRILNIDRLDLHLQGFAPRTAEEATRLLGPALAQALSQLQQFANRNAGDIDAGRINAPASTTAPDLAASMARQIAQHTKPRS